MTSAKKPQSTSAENRLHTRVRALLVSRRGAGNAAVNASRQLSSGAASHSISRKDEDRGAEGQDAASGLTPGAFGGATAGTDEPHKETGEAEGGTGGGIAGAWRGMTSSFSVGADDMAGSAAAGTVEDDIGMKVNPVDELPPGPAEMSGPAAEARAGGFGQQRDPQAQEDQTAPADMAQKARDISSPGAQEDATASGPKGGV